MKLTTIAALAGGAFLALAAMAAAQTTYTFSGTCGKPAIQHTVPSGEPGRTYAVTHGTCTTNDKIGGQTATSGSWADMEDLTANLAKANGIYTETFPGGAKVYYGYSQTLHMNGTKLVSGSATFNAIGGTGKFKGITASGTCEFTPGPKGDHYSCTGSYTLAKR